MTPRFSVRDGPHLRAARSTGLLISIPNSRTHNVSRRLGILKLKNVPVGAGQYRLRLGRFRFRYDVSGREVQLVYCGLRREDLTRPADVSAPIP